MTAPSLPELVYGTQARMAAEWGRVYPDTSRDRWFIDFWHQSRRYRVYSVLTVSGESLPLRTREMAEDLRALIRAEVAQGRDRLEVLARHLGTRNPEHLFRRCWDRFVEHKARQQMRGEISAKRLAGLECHDRNGDLEPLLDRTIHELGYARLEDWAEWLRARRPRKAKTIQHIIADVGACLRWLHRRGELQAMPRLPEVRIPTQERFVTEVPSQEVLEAILGAIPAEIRGLWLAQAHMGLRPSEARQLTVGDYDWGRGLLTVRLSKSPRPRILPVAPVVRRWIEQWVGPGERLRGVGPLFRNPRARVDGWWSGASERRVWYRACREVGVKVRPYSGGRHYFGTAAARRGTDAFRLQSYMGHTDPRTTSRYIELSGEGLSGVLGEDEDGPDF